MIRRAPTRSATSSRGSWRETRSARPDTATPRAFKLGLTYVVQRNGETIARITLGALPGSPLTGATIEACHYAGIDTAKIDGA